MQRSRTTTTTTATKKNPQDKRVQDHKRMSERPTVQESMILSKLTRMFPQANREFLLDFVKVLNVCHQYHLREIMSNIPASINELVAFVRREKVRETPRFVWVLVKEYANYFAGRASTVSPHKMEQLLRAIPVPTTGCNGGESNMYVYAQGIGRMLSCMARSDLASKRTQLNLVANLTISSQIIVRYYILMYTFDSVAAADYASYELLSWATRLRRQFQSGQVDKMVYAYRLVQMVQRFVTTYRFQLTCLCLLRLMQMVPYQDRSTLYLAVYPYLNDIDLSTNQYRLIHFMYTIPGINLDTDPAIAHTKYLMQQSLSFAPRQRFGEMMALNLIKTI